MKRPLLVLSLCALACSSTTEQSVPAPTDGGTDGSDALPPIDSGADAGSDAPATAKSGSISLWQTTIVASGSTSYSATAAASFRASEADPTTIPCTTTTFGGCTLSVCVLTSGPSDAGVDAGPSTYPSAGDITLTGGKIETGGIVLSPDPTSGNYKVVKRTVKVFDGGDVITAKAIGAEVAAFDGKTVSAPAEILLTSPACKSGVCPDLDPTTDLLVTWTGGGSGDVFGAVGTNVPSAKKFSTITCTFRASDGKGTVPKEAIAKLDKANGTTVIGNIGFYPTSETTFSSGGYDVSLRLSGTSQTGEFKTK